MTTRYYSNGEITQITILFEMNGIKTKYNIM